MHEFWQEAFTAAVRAAGGEVWIVGGAVRDRLLGRPRNDIDVEVYGLDLDTLERVLRRRYTVSRVGIAWPILKVTVPGLNKPIDVSLPRRFKPGHGFVADPQATHAQACACRDTTINAMIEHPETGHVIDPMGGRLDLEQRCLRAADPSSFLGDPLRVLRVVRQAATLGFTVDPGLMALCRQASLAGVAGERIGEEWRRLLMESERPSVGLDLLRQTHQLEPELEALVGVPQDPVWHPEGDVWVHTCHVVDAAAHIARREGLEGDAQQVLIWAALCHDLGKATTTVHRQGRWSAPGHAAAGVPLAQALMERLDVPSRVIRQVLPLVREHMCHIHLRLESRQVRRLARRLGHATVRVWGWLVEADHSGRPPLAPSAPAQPIVDLARHMGLADQAPAPLVLGRHLIAVGLQPGPWFGPVLEQAFQAQLDGHFETVEEGLRFVREQGWLDGECAGSLPAM
ncbi:MAG: HD domain-containing protein [Myxococcota bacterium]